MIDADRDADDYRAMTDADLRDRLSALVADADVFLSLPLINGPSPWHNDVALRYRAIVGRQTEAAARLLAAPELDRERCIAHLTSRVAAGAPT